MRTNHGDDRSAAPGERDARDLAEAVHGADEETRREAACRLFSRYQGHVYAWCLRYARDRDRALDLAQDVLLGAYENLHRYEPRGKFTSWLFIVARNRCVSETRRPSAKEVFGLDLDLLAAGGPDPATALEEEEGRARILRLLREHLDEREQEAIWLRCFERMAVDDITEVLEIDERSGARGLLQRARRKLRAALAGENGALEE